MTDENDIKRNDNFTLYFARLGPCLYRPRRPGGRQQAHVTAWHGKDLVHRTVGTGAK